uniref:Uncharacterized protein n=1 Tax=Strigamia maritima TaxID=126957 RepID=T1J9F2_STRMM
MFMFTFILFSITWIYIFIKIFTIIYVCGYNEDKIFTYESRNPTRKNFKIFTNFFRVFLRKSEFFYRNSVDILFMLNVSKTPVFCIIYRNSFEFFHKLHFSAKFIGILSKFFINCIFLQIMNLIYIKIHYRTFIYFFCIIFAFFLVGLRHPFCVRLFILSLSINLSFNITGFPWSKFQPVYSEFLSK